MSPAAGSPVSPDILSTEPPQHYHNRSRHMHHLACRWHEQRAVIDFADGRHGSSGSVVKTAVDVSKHDQLADTFIHQPGSFFS
jgi:alpha-glucuronidase